MKWNKFSAHSIHIETDHCFFYTISGVAIDTINTWK